MNREAAPILKHNAAHSGACNLAWPARASCMPPLAVRTNKTGRNNKTLEALAHMKRDSAGNSQTRANEFVVRGGQPLAVAQAQNARNTDRRSPILAGLTLQQVIISSNVAAKSRCRAMKGSRSGKTVQRMGLTRHRKDPGTWYARHRVSICPFFWFHCRVIAVAYAPYKLRRYQD